mgnify:CR=1 FL=1
MTDINHHLYSLVREMNAPQHQRFVFTANGGGATFNETGAALATLTNPTAANSYAILGGVRPVLFTGGAIRMRVVARFDGQALGRYFSIGFSGGYPLPGADLYSVSVVDGKLVIMYATGGGTVVEVTREASFRGTLKVFDPNVTHTYDLCVWPNGRMELYVDDVLAHVLVASEERSAHQRHVRPLVQINTGQVSSITAELVLLGLDVFCERAPESKRQNVTLTIPADDAGAAFVNLLSEDHVNAWAEVERIRIAAGDTTVSYELATGAGVPAGTEVAEAGQKVASIVSGAVYQDDIEQLSKGFVRPADGLVEVWSGRTSIHRYEGFASVPATAMSLFGTLTSLASAGNVTVSVDFIVH